MGTILPAGGSIVDGNILPYEYDRSCQHPKATGSSGVGLPGHSLPLGTRPFKAATVTISVDSAR